MAEVKWLIVRAKFSAMWLWSPCTVAECELCDRGIECWEFMHQTLYFNFISIVNGLQMHHQTNYCASRLC